jgi:hypothetical protein
MKTLVILGIVADIFFILVMIDLIVHFKDNRRKAYILRVLKARKQMEDEYGIDPPAEVVEDDKHTHRGSRKDRREEDQKLADWISDLTTNEHALIDMYSDSDVTVMISLPEEVL